MPAPCSSSGGTWRETWAGNTPSAPQACDGPCSASCQPSFSPAFLSPQSTPPSSSSSLAAALMSRHPVWHPIGCISPLRRWLTEGTSSHPVPISSFAARVLLPSPDDGFCLLPLQRREGGSARTGRRGKASKLQEQAAQRKDLHTEECNHTACSAGLPGYADDNVQPSLAQVTRLNYEALSTAAHASTDIVTGCC